MANETDKGEKRDKADRLTETVRHLGRNLASLRSARGWSQAHFARIAGLPRSTVTQIESGDSNPSLKILLALAAALHVPLEELLAPPESKYKHVKAEDIPVVKQKQGVTVYGLLPDPISGMEMSRMEFEPKSRNPGVPHLPGTREYFTCIQGNVHVTVGSNTHAIGAGDVLAFAGSQPHAYHNEGAVKAVGVSVVIFAEKGV
jgi:XRE family transcriptional regulator, regulator of sulfur utilization